MNIKDATWENTTRTCRKKYAWCRKSHSSIMNRATTRKVTGRYGKITYTPYIPCVTGPIWNTSPQNHQNYPDSYLTKYWHKCAMRQREIIPLPYYWHNMAGLINACILLAPCSLVIVISLPNKIQNTARTLFKHESNPNLFSKVWTQKIYSRPFRFIENITSFYLLWTFRFVDYTLNDSSPDEISDFSSPS